MKKIIAILSLTLIIVLTFACPALAIVKESDSFYVADYANVLSDSTEQNIINTNGALEHYTGGQIVVVTVEYLDGLYADEYAARLMNAWGVGDATKNNGMLLLLATQENKAWLTQGAGIGGSFTDSKINSLMDKYFWKDFDNEKYDEAVNSLYKQLLGWYEDYYKVDITDGNTSSGGAFSIFDSLSSMMMAGAIAIFIIIFLSTRMRGGRRSYYGTRPFMPFFFLGNPFFRSGRNMNDQDSNNRGRWGGFGGRGGGGRGGGGGFGGGGFGGGGFGGGGFGGGGHSGGGGGGRR